MTATYKPRLESDLLDVAPQTQNHLEHCFSGYQCMKTNGSLVRSFTTEKRQTSVVNGGNKIENEEEDDIDHPYPQLEVVEAFLKEYSHSSTQKEQKQEDENLEEYRIDNDDDDGDGENDENGSSPILLSECPEFQAYLQPPQAFIHEGDQEYIDENEIIFGFMPRKTEKLLPHNKDVKDEEGAFLEQVEAVEEGSSHSQGNTYAPSPIRRFQSHNFSKDWKPSTASGVAALMNCAETEMSRLRIGAAGLRTTPLQNVVATSSPEMPSTPTSPSSGQMQAEAPQDTTTTTATTTTTRTKGDSQNRMHVQLAQINRMSEAVRIEFSNQLAHERALLELLELEYNRVRSEVRIAERQFEAAPSDLVNQLRHLRERLQQQKALIDDLEYQYLEDKTKYEEEKQSLVTLLNLQADASPKAPPAIESLEQKETKGLEDAYTYPTTVFLSSRPSSTSPSIPSPNARDSFNSHCGGHSLADGGEPPSAKRSVPSPRNGPMSAAQTTYNTNSNADFDHLPPFVSTASLVCHAQSNLAPNNHETTLPSSVFHQQNGLSFDETCSSGRQDLIESPHASSSLPGLNAHLATTPPNSSILLPTSTDLNQSCISSSDHFFHAVPPLLSSANSIGIKELTPIQCSDEVHIRQRLRTSSTTTRRVWQNGEMRPLTRYLPVPDDISFDLRHHLEVTCGHILCSPLLMPHLHVDASTCAGYLYKVDSRVTATPITNDSDNTRHCHCDAPSPDVSTVYSSPAFFSPGTKRVRRGPSGVTSPSGGGSFMTALFHRSRRGKRRWFVLDRRRRLLIYYSCHTPKSSNSPPPMKPKDVISFTDIIDVYPDQQARKSNTSSFCLLLVASCPPPPYQVAQQQQQQRLPPSRTRILSLAAPSPEAARVWIDALFTCAGAYLCLPRSQHQSHLEP